MREQLAVCMSTTWKNVQKSLITNCAFWPGNNADIQINSHLLQPSNQFGRQLAYLHITNVAGTNLQIVQSLCIGLLWHL